MRHQLDGVELGALARDDQAITSSSPSSEGTGIDRGGRDVGVGSSTCSTSQAEMFSPLRRIASFRRSTNLK